MNKQFFRFTLTLLMCLSVLSTAAAQVKISAVPSANNPAVGYQIEVSINIAGGSNIAGYDFRLTFNSTVLEFISIENSNYLPGDPFSTAENFRPDGTFVPETEPGGGSVRFAAATLTGTAEGDGTLAVARFKVLAETETAIELEDVVIGNRAAQPIAVASILGATITPTAAGADAEYLLSIPTGISLIHVPLKVTAVDGVAKTIESVSDLYDALGGEDNVIYLFTRDSQTQQWIGYRKPSDSTSVDRELTDDMGIITNLITPVLLRLRGSSLGTNGVSTITLNPGINLVGVPLRDSKITHVSDLFTLEGIADNVLVIMAQDNNGEFKQIKPTSGSADIAITGGQSFIMTALRKDTVTISGEGWTNPPEAVGAPPITRRGIKVDDVTPILALSGSIVDADGGLSNTNFRVTVKNRLTGRSVATVTGSKHHSLSNVWGSKEVGYQLTDVDFETKRAATVGDILDISAQSPHPLIGVEPLEYTVTAEDIQRGWIQLPALIAYEIPAETALLHNYPNPFNPETWIPYQLAHAADVTLTIYDAQGALVRQLDLGYQLAGYYTDKTRAAYWDGRNQLGEPIASGLYFYTLTANDFTATRRMLILK